MTAPLLLFMGTVVVDSPRGDVEVSRRARLTELAAIIATYPGCEHTTLDEAFYPGLRVRANARNTQVCKLRRWLGRDDAGMDFLPRYQAGVGYSLHPEVRSDWDVWRLLVPAGDPGRVPTADLEQALGLVRGRPFDGVRARHYGWADVLRQRMVSAITDVSQELAWRRLMEGRWRSAEEAALIGLMVEPGSEGLWRLRLRAIHARGMSAELGRAVGQLRAIAGGWGGDLEPETALLLGQLDDAAVSRGGYRLHLA